MRTCLDWINVGARLTRGSRVFVKPNLTFPTFRPGIMTNPACVEELVRYLKDYTDDITICEADSGGYNRFSITEVFERVGIADVAKRLDVKLLNLSFVPTKVIQVPGFRRLLVSLPAPVLDDCDLFVTVPVPKVHANTIVSMSLKNQWGLIQEPRHRLKLHSDFARVIHAITKALPPAISVIDGLYGLNRNGPMRGEAVRLDWLAASDDLYLADVLGCRLIGMNPSRIPYLRYILTREGITGHEEMDLNRDPEPFVARTPFYLSRDWTDYPGLATFRSRLLAYLGYESSLAGPLHRCLYRFRQPFY